MAHPSGGALRRAASRASAARYRSDRDGVPADPSEPPNRGAGGGGRPDRRAAAPRALLGLALALLFPLPAQAAGDWDKWSVTVFAGIGTDRGIEDFPGIRADFNDAYLLAVAPNRELVRFGAWAAVEVEGQAVQHFRKQDHTELNAALVLRWLKFPWDKYLETSFAVGDGVSLASSIPQIERERSPGRNSAVLNYLFGELELKPPDEKRWSFVLRLHHRSGVYGLFRDVSLGSNFLAAGLKYRF